MRQGKMHDKISIKCTVEYTEQGEKSKLSDFLVQNGPFCSLNTVTKPFTNIIIATTNFTFILSFEQRVG